MGITDLKTLKATYIQLAKQHHPDIGGNDDIMKEINAERDKVKEWLDNGNISNFDYSSSYQTHQHDKPQSLDDLLRIAKRRNYKIGWVAINALKFAKSYEDCLNIAKACNYKPGWAYYKWREISQQ